MSFPVPIPGKDTMKLREYCNFVSSVETGHEKDSDLALDGFCAERWRERQRHCGFKPHRTLPDTIILPLRIRNPFFLLECGFDRVGRITETPMGLETVYRRSFPPLRTDACLSVKK
jgi:hypothetical protein